MNILGIDPGSLITGYGLIKASNSQLEFVSCETLVLSTLTEIEKLSLIYEKTKAIIDLFKPQEASIEKVFYAKNIRSTLILGQARAAILLACAKKKIKIYSYTATQVKQTICGYGAANKKQVYRSLTYLINCPDNLPSDATDALAIACCHNFCSQYNKKLSLMV